MKCFTAFKILLMTVLCFCVCSRLLLLEKEHRNTAVLTEMMSETCTALASPLGGVSHELLNIMKWKCTPTPLMFVPNLYDLISSAEQKDILINVGYQSFADYRLPTEISHNNFFYVNIFSIIQTWLMRMILFFLQKTKAIHQ